MRRTLALLLGIEDGQSHRVHVVPVFTSSQTSPGFGIGFLREEAEIGEGKPTTRLVSMGGQHRNQTSAARETFRILHPDIRFATEDRGSSQRVRHLWALRCGDPNVLRVSGMDGEAV